MAILGCHWRALWTRHHHLRNSHLHPHTYPQAILDRGCLSPLRSRMSMLLDRLGVRYHAKPVRFTRSNTSWRPKRFALSSPGKDSQDLQGIKCYVYPLVVYHLFSQTGLPILLSPTNQPPARFEYLVVVCDRLHSPHGLSFRRYGLVDLSILYH